METKQTNVRLLSLDFFRGLTMFLLVAETTELYSIMNWEQMHHATWHGFRFWDLIQPFFMFIVGVAIPLSLAQRIKKGSSYAQNYKHIFIRCLLLLLLGVGLQCSYSGKLVWELWGVLCQLSVTILMAYAIMNWRAKWQLIFSVALLLLTDLVYRYFPLDGFNHPFVMGENFGSWMDTILMGKINSGGWVAINCIPTAAHTIWGVVVGKMLMDPSISHYRKLKTLLIAGCVCLVIGYGLDLFSISPIIKRISPGRIIVTMVIKPFWSNIITV